MATAAPASRRAVLAAYAGIMLATLLAALDQTIVATALPGIVADLRAFEDLSWIVTAYLVASTVTVPIYGKLGDLHGRRRMFVVAISIFLLGSLLCALAQNVGQLVGARVVQGLGAGGLLPLAQTAIADLFSPRERGRYQGLIGAMWAIAAIAGPLLGGTLTDSASWRWIFWLNLPLGVIALVVVMKTMRVHHERREHTVDVAGAVTLSVAVVCVLLACSWGGSRYAWGSPEVLGAAVCGALAFAAFLRIAGARARAAAAADAVPGAGVHRLQPRVDHLRGAHVRGDDLRPRLRPGGPGTVGHRIGVRAHPAAAHVDAHELRVRADHLAAPGATGRSRSSAA